MTLLDAYLFLYISSYSGQNQISDIRYPPAGIMATETGILSQTMMFT